MEIESGISVSYENEKGEIQEIIVKAHAPIPATLGVWQRIGNPGRIAVSSLYKAPLPDAKIT